MKLKKRKFYKTFRKFIDSVDSSTVKGLNKYFDRAVLEDPLKMDWILKMCLKHEEVPIIEYLLARGHLIGVLNRRNQTAIHAAFYCAAYNGHFEVVRKLFRYYGTARNYVNDRGLSHFHVACMAGDAAVVEAFLDDGNCGVDPNERWTKDGRDLAPLHLAVKFGRSDVVELLLRRGADPDAQCSLGVTPLHLAVGYVNDRPEITSLIDVRIFENSLLAETHDDTVLARILLDHGARVNLRNGAGDTPLACVMNDNRIRTALSCTLVDISEVKFEHLRKGQMGKMRLLLSRGADPRTVNEAGDTMLHHVVKNSKWSRRIHDLEDMNYDDEYIAKMASLLLKEGVEVDARNGAGESPLQLAVGLLNYKTVLVLLEHKADVGSWVIRFDRLEYPRDIIPYLPAVDNLIRIVDALEKRGVCLSHRANVDIMKFFLRNNQGCFSLVANVRTMIKKMQNVLKFGSEMAVMRNFDNFSNRTFHTLDEQNCVLKAAAAELISLQLRVLDSGILYASQELKNFLRYQASRVKDPYQLFSAIYTEEIDNIKLLGSTRLGDVLRNDPRHGYRRIRSIDCGYLLQSWKYKRFLSFTLGIVEGHFAKCLVRWYAVKVSRDCLRTLLGLSLPDDCCDEIMDRLENEDLLNLCIAAEDDEGEGDEEL